MVRRVLGSTFPTIFLACAARPAVFGQGNNPVESIRKRVALGRVPVDL